MLNYDALGIYYCITIPNLLVYDYKQEYIIIKHALFVLKYICRFSNFILFYFLFLFILQEDNGPQWTCSCGGSNYTINVINVCIYFTRVRIKYSIIIINYYVQYIACGI